MICNDVRATLEDYVDGLVRAPTAEDVREHLERCEPCRLEVDASRAASLAMADWGDLEPPPDCFETILARIEVLPADALEPLPAPAAPLRRVGTVVGWWAATAAVALLAFLFGVEVTDSIEPAVPALPVAASFAGFVPPEPVTLVPLEGEEAMREATPEEVAEEDEDFLDHNGVRRRLRVIPVRDAGSGTPFGLPANPIDRTQTPR